MDENKTANTTTKTSQTRTASSEQSWTACPEPSREKNRRGLECRYCGCKHFRVIYTRPTWGGRIMRRRQCRHCGKRMTTWEK
jgi:DNA-directed RNA polymerase subunit RPC12/RpoP